MQCPLEKLYSSFDDLADYLAGEAEDEVQKVRACFTWLCSVDVASLQHRVDRLPELGTPLDLLLKINWGMANHAHVFNLVCK